MEKNVLTIRVPLQLKEQMHRLAKAQGVSVNQLAVYAFSKEMKALEAAAFFDQRMAKLNTPLVKQNADSVLAKVQNRAPFDPSDEVTIDG